MPPLKWKKAGRKWTLRSALEAGTMTVAQMNTQERAELAQFLQTQFMARKRQFDKAGTMGYAVTKLENDMAYASKKLNMNLNPNEKVVYVKGKNRRLSPAFADRKNPQNALASYIAAMQGFFSAKSSTVSGWEEIGRKQDARLFGVERRYYTDKKGKLRFTTSPTHSMSDSERRMFWKVYDELYRAGWTSVIDYSSESQREVATKWINGDFDKLDFDSAYASMLKMVSTRPDDLPEDAPGDSGNPFQQGEEYAEHVGTWSWD